MDVSRSVYYGRRENLSLTVTDRVPNVEPYSVEVNFGDRLDCRTIAECDDEERTENQQHIGRMA